MLKRAGFALAFDGQQPASTLLAAKFFAFGNHLFDL
jgi:hypothetical protein